MSNFQNDENALFALRAADANPVEEKSPILASIIGALCLLALASMGWAAFHG